MAEGFNCIIIIKYHYHHHYHHHWLYNRGGLWRPDENFTSVFSPGQPTANFYNPVSLRLPLPHQTILISVAMSSVTSRVCPQYLFRKFVFIHSHYMARPLPSTGFYYIHYVWFNVKLFQFSTVPPPPDPPSHIGQDILRRMFLSSILSLIS